MAIKQPVTLNFSEGLETKVDPKQVQFGKFLALTNSVFTTQGRLTKRNGFGSLASLPDSSTTYLTTFNGNLTAIGSTLEAYVDGTSKWINKGAFTPLSLSVTQTVRSSLSQIQCDSVIAANGLVCTVYTESNAGVASYKYTVQDSTTSQNIVLPTAIPVAAGTVSGSPRVFLLGGYFIVVFTNTNAGQHLQYIAISTTDPTIVTVNADIAASYVPASTVAWDGVVVGQNLYIAYNTTAGGQSVKIAYLTSSLLLVTAQTFAASIATVMSMTADVTNSQSPVIYAAFYDSAGSTGKVIAVDQNLNKLMTSTQIIATGTVNNITATAKSGIVTVAYELANNYSYDAAIPSNIVKKVSVTLPATVTTGTVGSTTTILRSMGLASKAFLMNSTMYMLGEYYSVFQPTYFLFDTSGNIISRFAYQNGGGYLTLGLPQAQVIDDTVNIAYLYKDLIQSVNKSQGLANAAGVYTQTGVNLASLTYTSSQLTTAEIGANLNLSGGFLYAYDGSTLTEQGFHVYPDNVETLLVGDPGPTGTVTNTSVTITALSSVTGVVVGMNVSGTGIPASTTVIAVGTTTVTMSAAATSTHVGELITFTGNMSAQKYYYQAIYQWTDARGNVINSSPSIPVSATTSAGITSVVITVPTLRLSYKTGVKIVIYRWSPAQETYYQVTSITSPLLNSTSLDSVSFQDISSDAQILGNSIIYTNGGVVENIAGPACTAITLFDDRLWLIYAEDKNLLGFSKQTQVGEPVELSDLFTFYVAPTTGAQGSTGDMNCVFPMDDKIIIFKNDAIYYVNGIGPDNTGANNNYSPPIFTTSTVGCANQNSIVMTDLGLMFQADKGIYLLRRDGMTTDYIGSPVEAYNHYTVNSAVTVPGTTQIRFTLSNGVILMYDTFYGQWGVFEKAPAISSTLYQSLHTIVNSSGIVSQETPGVYMDNGNPVLIGFTTSWISLAGINGYERIYEFLLNCTYISPHKLILQVAFDYGQPTQQVTISPTNYTGVYGSDDLYGQTSPYGGPQTLEEWRIHTNRQKCQAFQISLQEVFDPTFGTMAGAGFTMSGITCVVGIKKGYKPIKGANTVG